MTLKARNNLLMVFFLLSLACIVALVLRATNFLEGAKIFSTFDLERPLGLLQKVSAPFFPPLVYVDLIAPLFLLFFSALCQLSLYRFFEKTHVSEIFYLSLFFFSLSFESIRIVLINGISNPWTQTWLIYLSRSLLFSRLLGLFSFFASSLVAHNPDFRKQGRTSLILIGVSLLIATSSPQDTFSWLSTGTTINGYRSMFFWMELTLILFSLLSYLSSAFLHQANQVKILIFATAAMGLGRDALFYGDNIVTLILGMGLLGSGTFFMLRRIHSYYLWI